MAVFANEDADRVAFNQSMVVAGWVEVELGRRASAWWGHSLSSATHSAWGNMRRRLGHGSAGALLAFATHAGILRLQAYIAHAAGFAELLRLRHRRSSAPSCFGKPQLG